MTSKKRMFAGLIAAAVLLIGSSVFFVARQMHNDVLSQSPETSAFSAPTQSAFDAKNSAMSHPNDVPEIRPAILEALNDTDGPLSGIGPTHSGDVTIDLQGPGFALVHYSRPDNGVLYAVVDIYGKEVTSYRDSGSYTFRNHANTFYSIDGSGMILYYKLDQPQFNVIPESDLSSSPTDSYDSGDGDIVRPVITHQSDNEITLAVFKRLEFDQQAEAYASSQKKDGEGHFIPDRYITITLP